MGNTDTSQKEQALKPDYSWINDMRRAWLAAYKELVDSKQMYGARTRKFSTRIQDVPFDKDIMNIRLKPASFVGLLSILRMAALFRELQSKAGKLPDGKKKQLEDILGGIADILVRCNADNCALDGVRIRRLLNHTLDPYCKLQSFKWDTDPSFGAFLDILRATSTVKPNGKDVQVHMHMEPLGSGVRIDMSTKRPEKEEKGDDSAGTTAKED